MNPTDGCCNGGTYIPVGQTEITGINECVRVNSAKEKKEEGIRLERVRIFYTLNIGISYMFHLTAKPRRCLVHICWITQCTWIDNI